ncbi:hypothetical protein H2200_008217 [Cladophialophora chaetospira]|uniref:Peptidase S33 tripeptidyl aminopeptidase-like C-terminal domain-containing protein n=1 Tax=Cladophialophora chaetospira TaxID=386627 RepID=A0AA38X5C8_9EURO|nr:hypothetical protein H2200_008217 [Cladophialophora chaetospira]
MLSAILLSATVLAVSIIDPARATPISTSTNQTLAWTNCTSVPDGPYPQHFRCAKLEVPLYYENPASDKIKLTLVKIPATNTAKRIGTWIFQEGGPGTSTAHDLPSIDGTEGFRELQTYFDVLAVDPRGVGVNFPVCFSPELLTSGARGKFRNYPKTEGEWKATLEYWGEVGEDCLNRTGPIFHTLSSATAARDLESARVALGEGGINYYGLSWGIQRGQMYAQYYPKNIRTMVLDGVVDHSIQMADFSAAQQIGHGFSAANFFNWASTNSSSALYGQDAAKIMDDLVAKADQTPIPVPNVNTTTTFPNVTGEDIRQAFLDGFWHEYNWPAVATWIAESAQGNVTGFAMPVFTETSLNSPAIACSDWLTNETYAQFPDRERMAASFSSGNFEGGTGMRAWATYCSKWPIPVVNPPARSEIANTSAPILLVNALWDPATPYDFAVNIQRQIPGSVLLTRKGNGHGSLFPWGGEAGDAMSQYFVSGKPPPAGTVVYS